MSATIPALSMHVNADVTASLGGTSRTLARSGNTNGLGDVVLMPLMLNYNVHRDFNVNVRLGAYAPTGNYEVGRLANTGKNFWTIEPVLGSCTSARRTASRCRSSAASTSTPRTWIPTTSRGNRSMSTARSPALPTRRRVGRRRSVRILLPAGHGRRRLGCDAGRIQGMTTGLGPALSYAHKVGGHDTIVELSGSTSSRLRTGFRATSCGSRPC